MEDAAIVGDGTMLTKYQPPPSVRLISIGDLSYHPQDSLGGEKEQILDAEVESLLNGIPVEGTMLPGPVADKVGSVVGTFKSFQQGGGLLKGGAKFDLDGQFHTPSISRNSTIVSIATEERESYKHLFRA